MTTESNNTETRTISELIDGDVPYSEMTPEEIEKVIEFRAKVKADSEAYQEAMRVHKETAERVIEAHTNAANTAKSDFERLCAGILAGGE